MTRLEKAVVVSWCIWVVAGFGYLVYQASTVRHAWWLP